MLPISFSVNTILIIANVLMSVICFSNYELRGKLTHYPYYEYRNKEYYRFFTSGFIHADWMHLIFNMITLWSFGEQLETQFTFLFGETMGHLNYLVFYIMTMIFADIPSYYKYRNNSNYSALGASGAVSGVLMVFSLFYPWATIIVYAFPVWSILAMVLYLVYSSYAAKRGGDNIDHSAHFYGAVFGALLIIILKPEVLAIFFRQLMKFPWLN